jgi:hypothetical protein
VFDFARWCSWVEAWCLQASIDGMTISFNLGQPSPKGGATVTFATNRKLMQFAFWETGEADFYGLELPGEKDIVGFYGRVLDDSLFEPTFRECLSTAT